MQAFLKCRSSFIDRFEFYATFRIWLLYSSSGCFSSWFHALFASLRNLDLNLLREQCYMNMHPPVSRFVIQNSRHLGAAPFLF